MIMNRYRKSRLIVVFVVIIFVHLAMFNKINFKNGKSEKFVIGNQVSEEIDKINHRDIVKRFYDNRKSWKTSNLGSIMFKNTTYENFERNGSGNRTFIVLIWKYWDWLKRRHVYNFDLTRKNKSDQILEDCHVKNCKFYGDDKYMDSADAVVVHTQRKIFPKVLKRNPKQRWIFLNDESPKNIFSMAQSSNKITLSDMGGVFNWTMTYRSDSDIPVPYGRTVPLRDPIPVDLSNATAALHKLVPYWKNKHRDPLVMIMTSNCVNFRTQIIHGLQKFMNVDVFGACTDKPENKNKCPGHFSTDCMLPSNYLFYLVLENSQCREYITEKIFQHAYSKGAIPVIMGSPLKDYKNLLPPNSYIFIPNFKNLEKLSKFMLEISRDEEKILYFHQWRKHFLAHNEHGYFKTRSYHLCRVCEALNYNDKSVKIYSIDDLNLFFDQNKLCDLDYGSKLLYPTR